MLQVDIDARIRKESGKEATRNLRRNGKTPAVLYGLGKDPVSLEVDTKEMTKTFLFIQRRNAVANLAIEGGGNRHVMIKDIQSHPVHDTLLHADFYEIAIDEPQTFKVPVNYSGKAAGVEMGGDMFTYINEVHLKGKPLDIPDAIEVDVSSVGIDEQITCAELEIPEKAKMLEDGDQICLTVNAPVIAG
ncbi:MAG: 50S ribosomal protein L25 [Desulfurivibrionaceae bacterium]